MVNHIHTNIAEQDRISIRKMKDTNADYQLMLTWLSDVRVNEWYFNQETPTLDFIRKKYLPRIKGEHHVQANIIESDGIPVGYVQFYKTKDETEYVVKIPLLKEDDVWALDIFIGDPEQWGKGIASKALKMMVDHLFKERNAKKIIIDPDVRNERAIRAYEKAGFKKQEILHNWEKHNNKWTDAWLMICERKPHT